MEPLKFKTRNGVSYSIWFSRNVTQRSAELPTGRGDEAAPSSSNLVMYRTATPRPLLYCPNRIPPALQTPDDPIAIGSPARRQQKTVPVPWLKEFEPPRQIQLKFSNKAYRMVLSTKSWETIDHTSVCNGVFVTRRPGVCGSDHNGDA